MSKRHVFELEVSVNKLADRSLSAELDPSVEEDLLKTLSRSCQTNPSQTPSASRPQLITRHTIAEITENLETDATIWLKTRHPDIRKPIQNFLLRPLHGSLRIGDFWNKIPHYEPRAKFDYPDESLEHILTDCPSIEALTIWSLLQRIWPAAQGDWKKSSFGEILGCGCLTPPNPHPNQRGERYDFGSFYCQNRYT